jgi:hypothetical protein
LRFGRRSGLRPTPTNACRIFNTHLAVGASVTGTTQERQGDQYLAMIAASPYPVIALGDLNSPADGSSTPTYRNLTAVLHDAWTSARPVDPGWTCCQAPPLADPVGREFTRIDLALTPQDWSVTRVAHRRPAVPRRPAAAVSFGPHRRDRADRHRRAELITALSPVVRAGRVERDRRPIRGPVHR